MKERLGGKPSRAAGFPAAARRSPLATGNIILGIDPSLRGTGYGVIQFGKSQSRGARARHHFLPERLGTLALPG